MAERRERSLWYVCRLAASIRTGRVVCCRFGWTEKPKLQWRLRLFYGILL